MTKRERHPGEPGPWDPCPCQSGSKSKFCCLKARGWLKAPAAVSEPISTRTTSGCYAAHLQTCEGKLTSEHYVSADVLRIFGATVKIRGLSWLAGETKTLPVETLGPRMLCEGHNRALSPIDKCAGAFLRSLMQHRDALKNQDAVSELRLFAGEDLERFALKWMIGAMVSRANSVEGVRVGVDQNGEAFQELVEVLFGRVQPTAGMGLYILPLEEAPTPIYEHLEAAILVDEKVRSEVCGMSFNLFGIPAAYLLAEPKQRTALYSEALFRPKFVSFQKPDGVVLRHLLSWTDWRHGKGYTLEFRK